MEAAWNEALARFGPGGMVCGFTTGLTLLLVGAFAFLDATKPTITWRYRIQQRLAPPEHMRLGVQLFLFNLFAIHTPSTLAFPAEAMGIETAAPFPSPAAIALQIALCFVLNDFTAYWLHWLEHKIPFLYKHAHKVHHKVRCPSAFHFMCMHPVEYLLGNMASSIAVMLVKPHLVSILLFSALRLYQGVVDHCGYSLPLDVLRFIPFAASAEFHDGHHSTNTGNFGECFTLWDRLMGTAQVANPATGRPYTSAKHD